MYELKTIIGSSITKPEDHPGVRDALTQGFEPFALNATPGLERWQIGLRRRVEAVPRPATAAKRGRR